MKHFNTTGICYPDKHYMADIQNTIQQISKMVQQGDYFTINRARQYGKTTTMALLEGHLQEEFYVINTSFEGMGDKFFSSESGFVQGFIRNIRNIIKYTPQMNLLQELWMQNTGNLTGMDELSEHISTFCSECEKPVVLMIDEIDKSSDNQIFLNFLGMLRNKFLQRRKIPTFQSVILAGVYDIKNLKLKLRPNTEHKYNSPWNIAADFNIDMSFSTTQIASMINEYDKDYHIGMDVRNISKIIYDYTSGYPFLVSRICQIMDEKILGREHFEKQSDVWTRQGVLEAVKELLKEKNTLFSDMVKKIHDYPKLRQMLQDILFCGRKFPYNEDNYIIEIGSSFGFIKNQQNIAVVSNRIFETRIYNFFLLEEMTDSQIYDAASISKNQFINGKKLNMELVLNKFLLHFTDIYSDCDEKFLEENGRRFFLLYLSPIINGTGNYYIEAQTRDMKRTDVIIDYLGQRYVVEMKIWRGEEYNLRGEEQLWEYLEYYHLDKGYMLSFCFNKNKKVGVQEIYCNGKILVEAVVYNQNSKGAKYLWTENYFQSELTIIKN